MLPGERPEPTMQSEFRVPPAGVPQLGQCRIWYADLPPEWQPPDMSCARAHSLARKHGGRVIKAISPGFAGTSGRGFHGISGADGHFGRV